MSHHEVVEDAFPELEAIENLELRETVIRIWADALQASDYADLNEIPWWPPFDEEVDHEKQVPHVRDVTAFAIAIVDGFARRRPDLQIDRDLVIAGALLHDISKFYETDRDGLTELETWLPHPHYSVHLLADAGCSLHLQHVVLAHTDNTNVEPRTLEAEIVRVADELAVAGMLWEHTGQLTH